MSELYNYEYYHSHCGPIAYEEPAHWIEFFGGIADRIVNDLKPKTVLDAGCAMGYLVAVLRDRGVEAYGVDISEYAISKVREDIKQYCAVGSLTEPLPACLPKRYDLVVTIEVLEHLYEDDGRKAIQNLCELSDQIIFSSTPDDFTERTHFNVQQREYWARLFAAEGFFDDLNYRPQYISRQAIFFKKCNDCVLIADNFERFIRILENQYLSQADELSKQIQRVKNQDHTIQEHIIVNHERDKKIAEQLTMIQERDETIREHIAMVHERDEKIAEQLSMIQERDETIREHIAMVHERDEKIAEQLSMIQERDETIREHIAMVHEQDKKIAEQLAMVQERDETIWEHIAMVHERDEKIAEQLAMVRESDETIQGHIAMIEEQNRSIVELKGRLLACDSKIETQDLQIQRQKEIIQRYTPPWIKKKLT